MTKVTEVYTDSMIKAQRIRLSSLSSRTLIRLCLHILILNAVITLCPQNTRAERRQRQSTSRLITFPLTAPHLSSRAINKQTKSLITVLKKSDLTDPLPLSEVRSGLRAQNFSLDRLRRPHSVEVDVYRLCIRLQSRYALSVQMKLGTDRKPARLIGTVFFCHAQEKGLDRFELPFEGRLNSRVWAIFSEQLYETLSSPRSRPLRRVRSTAMTVQDQQRFNHPQHFNSTATQNLSSQAPVTFPMDQGQGGVAIDRNAKFGEASMIPMTEPKPPPSMSPDHASLTESSRFSFGGGPRFLTKSFSYKTQEESRVLRGGLSYDSQWLIGWGLYLVSRPFSGSNSLRGLTLRGSFSRFTYDSIRVIRSPFDPPIEVSAPSDLSRWSAGFAYAYPLRTMRRAHQFGFSLTYYGELMNLTPNPEYLGLDLHLIDLSIFGEFILSPGTLYLSLEGGIRPFASHGNRVTELGSSAESYGGASSIGFRYRSPDGLTLGLKLQLSVLYSTPIGEGRGGRIGTEAKDQTITLDLNLGYSSNPIHQ